MDIRKFEFIEKSYDRRRDGYYLYNIESVIDLYRIEGEYNMTLGEAERFYQYDKQKYIIEKNKDLLTWLKKSVKAGYRLYMNISDLQKFIDDIVCWYEIKYPNRELEISQGVTDSRFESIERLSKYMSMEQLRYRLSHNSLLLMDCEFRMKDNRNIMIHNNDVEIMGCNDIQIICDHSYDLELRRRLLQIVVLKLLYSKNTTPEMGYIRVQKFVEEFNQELKLTISLKEAHEIMSRDYATRKIKKRGN